jgi:hypothetical protein
LLLTPLAAALIAAAAAAQLAALAAGGAGTGSTAAVAGCASCTTAFGTAAAFAGAAAFGAATVAALEAAALLLRAEPYMHLSKWGANLHCNAVKECHQFQSGLLGAIEVLVVITSPHKQFKCMWYKIALTQ